MQIDLTYMISAVSAHHEQIHQILAINVYI
jgi:hypothetical protein